MEKNTTELFSFRLFTLQQKSSYSNNYICPAKGSARAYKYRTRDSSIKRITSFDGRFTNYATIVRKEMESNLNDIF